MVVFYSLTEAGQLIENPKTDIADVRIELLSTFPAVSGVTAIREGRYHPISSISGQPGPSSVRAVEQLARVLHPERFAQ